MNCRDYQHQVTLLLYEELPEHERPELEAHLRQCEGCKHFYEEEKGLQFVLAEDAAATWDIPTDLLVESRRSLANELDRMERKRAWWRIPTFSVVLTPMRMLESAALVAMGLALGVYVNQQQVSSQVASTPQVQTQDSLFPRNAALSNLRIVKSDPATGNVELAGEVVQPLRFQGSMEDATVRRLLMSALRDASNPTSRLRAVEVLGQRPTDEMVEEALIDALVYDENVGVRHAALEALQESAGKENVRTALMHTLANDLNPAIRVDAIEALTTYANDSETARSVRELTRQEENPYIRMKALQFVGGQ
jgi:HEAT repeat protein